MIEGDSALAARVRDLVTQSPHSYFVSGFVRAECLIAPIRANDESLVRTFEKFFELTPSLQVSELDFETAAKIRANSGLLLLDALHIAVSHSNACDEFWTADTHFKRMDGKLKLNVRLLD